MPSGRIIIYASSHGWGHNARLIPIIDQLWEYNIEICSTAPEWFIETSLTHKRRVPIKVRNIKTDPGCVQSDPFNIDVEKTIESWKEVFGQREKLLSDELEYLKDGEKVVLIISDISYFGALVGEALNVPSLCVATFDWAFVYQNVMKEHEDLAEIIEKVQELSKKFDYCLVPGTECEPLNIGKQKIKFHWLSRKPRIDKTDMRKKLGLNLYQDSVLLSFGGHTLNKIDPRIWKKYEDLEFFVILPENECGNEPAENVHYLNNKEWSKYHTDLVNTVDIVFGKVGYGLCSEVTNCGTSMLIVDSNWNPESEILKNFMKTTVCTEVITPEQFTTGKWDVISQLIEKQREPDSYTFFNVDGEVQIASWIRSKLGDKKPKEPSSLSINWIVIAVIVLIIAFLVMRK